MIGVLVMLVALSTSAQMSEAHRKWLEEEVVYIITDREKEVFESLQTVEERDRFIDAFWARRDPNPASPENEYKVEHYRRIDHANEFLGRETFSPGWRTDRGRFYILLGEPKITQRFSGSNAIVDSELWFYQVGGNSGLPGAFYLLFFQRDGVGEYELYHPIGDGPTRLFRGTQLVLPDTDNATAVEYLEQIDPGLAHASLSYDAGQPPDYMTGRASLGSDAVLMRIEASPKRAVRTDYLDAFLRYGNRVAAEYSFNFVPSRASFAMLVGPEDTAIVQYTLELEPEHFGLATDENETKYYTTLDVTFEARTADGTIVLANDRSDYLELSPAQVQQIERFPIAYQDNFPLLPGTYTVSVILRNRALKKFTVAETELDVPDYASGQPMLIPPILAYQVERLAASSTEREVRTFQLGSLRLEPASDSTFAISDVVYAFTQAVGAPDGARVRFDLGQDPERLDSAEVTVDAVSGAALGELSTLGAAGGNYELRARLLGPDGAELSEQTAAVLLSPRTSVIRPNFVYRRGFNPGVPGLLSLVLGDQWWSLKNVDRAIVEYEKAVAAENPQLPQAQWKLAHAYLAKNRYEDALARLTPLEASFPSQYEVVAGLGLVSALRGDNEKAVSYLERAATLRAPDAATLNALGEAHEKLGNVEQARTYYERSLGLNPDQPAVKARLASLK